MTKTPLRILISNDDGIHAHGLKVLYRIAKTLSDDVWVAAPETEQSCSAHSLSIHTPLRLRKLEEQRYSVNGTPTDCILVTLGALFKDKKPDLVLSGVNHGGNLGEDVTYSGTVAAAMEATLLGVPAIALSQVIQEGGSIQWSTVERFAPEIIAKLIAIGWPKNVLININFPDVAVDKVKSVEIVKQGQRNLTSDLVQWEDPYGDPFYWVGALRDSTPTEANTDLSAIQESSIAITPLHLDLTHYETLEKIRGAFK